MKNKRLAGLLSSHFINMIYHGDSSSHKEFIELLDHQLYEKCLLVWLNNRGRHEWEYESIFKELIGCNCKTYKSIGYLFSSYKSEEEIIKLKIIRDKSYCIKCEEIKGSI